MNIFEEIEGLSGENLVTALLRILLLRSEDIRQSLEKSCHYACSALPPAATIFSRAEELNACA